MADNTPALSASGRLVMGEWFPILIGLIALYVPTWVDLSRTIWAAAAQAHGPLILGVALWFLWKQGPVIHELAAPSRMLPA